MLRKNRGKEAFTLIEMLVALLILSFIIQISFFLISQFRQSMVILYEDKHANFYHFSHILQKELGHYHHFKIYPNRITMRHKESNNFAELKVINNKIAKSPGHQILLYEVNRWNIRQIANYLWIQVDFSNQQSFTRMVSLEEME